MGDLSLHLAPNAPWPWLALVSAGLVVLGIWAYRFAVPPLPRLARRALSALRLMAFLLLLWLLGEPVLDRALGGGPVSVVALVDRSASMNLAAAPGGPTRAQAADEAVEALRRAWRGRARVEVVTFARTLEADSAGSAFAGTTAIGDALTRLAHTPTGRDASGIVVVSDGTLNAGADPARVAASLGIPVHTVLIGETDVADRSVTAVETSVSARVGEATPVLVRVESSEAAGTPMLVRLLDGVRELDRATVLAPGPGAEAQTSFRVTPGRPGLAVWSAVLDSLPGEITAANNTRRVAVEVAPGRLGVLVITAGLNWDLAFLRRAWMRDSSLRVTTFVRGRTGWRTIDGSGADERPGPADLRGRSVVVLDALPAAEISPDFDVALARFAREGGGLLLLGGPLPGLSRYRVGELGRDLQVALDPRAITRDAVPSPTAAGRELTAWDDDAARGDRAWRSVAPLKDLVPVSAGAGDRVLIGSLGAGPPLIMARRIGRGQALMLNGTGVWRWSLSPNDDLGAERGARLWGRLVRWLAEPVQGEPLRVRPERWLTAGGETVRLFATLQDSAFRPVAGATVVGELRGDAAGARTIRLEPRAAGSYVAEIDGLAPGRYRVDVRALLGGRRLGRAGTDLAVDSWSLETARTRPDSITLAATARASGAGLLAGGGVEAWARGIETRDLVRRRTVSSRLRESPWVFAFVVGALGLEWAWRRRRGLP